MPKRLQISPVAPIGHSVKRFLVSYANGHGVFEERDTDDFPPSPEGTALKEERRQLGLSLGEAARALGISVSALSDLEHGEATCDWAQASATLVRTARLRK